VAVLFGGTEWPRLQLANRSGATRGHAGLAMSRCLADRSIDHVVLERGEVANTWRTERWDSLRLLTPNWQSRLPGSGYSGTESDGYRTLPQVIDFIAGYARAIISSSVWTMKPERKHG
jgi:cation diffusion facilitator CzcD-associated flavoprotein CzcO